MCMHINAMTTDQARSTERSFRSGF
eukprot:COSAG06_NODE_1223_length_10199_cov_3.394356_10_plen_24_part_01